MISKIGLERAVLFLGGLSGMTKTEIKKACNAEIKDLKSNLSIKTVRSYLTSYRKEAAKLGLQIDSFLAIKKAENQKIEKEYSIKVAKQSKAQKVINDFNGAIDTAVTVLNGSESVAELVAALCFLTGRRMVEILKTAKFTNFKNKSNVVTFEGQAKKRGAGVKYQIYTLNNDKDVVKNALKRIRELADVSQLDNTDVRRRYETRVNAKAIQLFSPFLGYCTCKDLRNAYATIATHLYKTNNQTVNSFLADILGHDDEDLTTANTYQKYYIEK